jgi:hypothetical protein
MYWKYGRFVYQVKDPVARGMQTFCSLHKPFDCQLKNLSLITCRYFRPLGLACPIFKPTPSGKSLYVLEVWKIRLSGEGPSCLWHADLLLATQTI